MEIFQQHVKTALEFYKFYHYHPPDINMKWPNVWSMPKPADFIVSNLWGEIGWIEVKDLTAKRYYSENDKMQFAKARDLDEKFKTYFYIVRFKPLQEIYWFQPSDLFHPDLPSQGIFAPEFWPGQVLPYATYSQEGYFGKVEKKQVLNLLSIPFFAQPQKMAFELPATLQVKESP